MTKLAIETTLEQLAVAIETDAGIKDQFKSNEPQAENMIPRIRELLEKNGKNVTDLKEIRVTVGPGSFTGLRIGLSTAKALAFGTKARLLAFQTFDLVKASHPNEKGVLAIDTKRGDLYTKDEDGSLAIKTEEGLKNKTVLHPNEKTDALTLLALPKDLATSPDPFYMRPPEISCKKA